MPINTELMNMMGGQAMEPAPQISPGGGAKPFDWNLLAMMLGRGAQAFSAEDPTSWQHGVGGVAAGLGESRKYAEAATKAQGERKANWDWLKGILSGGVTPQGMEGVTSIKAGKAVEGKLPEITLGMTPSRDAYEDIFGFGEVAPKGMEAAGGAPESLTPGGAGGRSAMAPFFRNLPEVGLL